MNIHEKIKNMNRDEYSKFIQKLKSDSMRYGIYPLCNNQAGMWSVARVSSDKENPCSNPVFKIDIEGGNSDKIKNTAKMLWASQDIFRYKFFEVEGETYQYLDRDAEFFIEEYEVSDCYEAEKNFCLRSFDLLYEYPIRFMLLTISQNKYILYISVHHIISDGWSDGLICRNFIDFYNGNNVDIGKYQYARYIVNKQSEKMKEKRAQDMLYWKQQLLKNDGFADMPLSGNRKDNTEGRSSVLSINIPENTSLKIRRAVSEFSCNLHALLLAAFALCMGKYTGKNNVNFGTTLANRDNMNYWKTVGDFASVIVLPVDTCCKGTVSEYIRYVKETLFNGMDHSSVVLGELINDIKFTRIDGVNPLYQIIFSVHSKKMLSGMNNQKNIALDGSEITIKNIERCNNSNFNLDLALIALDDGEGEIELQAEYGEKIFSESRIRKIIDTFLIILNNMIENPDELCNNIICTNTSLVFHNANYCPLIEGKAENLIISGENIEFSDGDICIADKNNIALPQCFEGFIYYYKANQWLNTGQYGMVDENSTIKLKQSCCDIVVLNGNIIDINEMAVQISEKYNIKVISLTKSDDYENFILYYKGDILCCKKLYDEYGISVALYSEDEMVGLPLKIKANAVLSDINMLINSSDLISGAYYDGSDDNAVIFRINSNIRPGDDEIDKIVNKFKICGLKIACDLNFNDELYWYNISELTGTQKKVYNIWKEILGQDSEFGVNDKFFEAGGSSVKVLKMLNMLNAEFNAEFNIGELFDCATVSKIAEYIDKSETTDTNNQEIEMVSF